MIANPIFVFFSAWFIVFFLYSLNLSTLLTPMKLETVYLVLGSGGFLFLGWCAASIIHKNFNYFNINIEEKYYIQIFTSKSFSKRLKLATYIWIFFTFIEILYFGNLPLFSLFGIGSSVRYTEFGIPAIHGFLNALYFSVVILYFFQSKITRSFSKLCVTFLLMMWPFLIMHRMMFVAIFIQTLFAFYLLRHRFLRVKTILYALIFLVIVVYIFGYIGDLRSGREHLLRIAQFSNDYPDWLPSGFAWVYLYLVTPLNNINYNILDFSVISSYPFRTLLMIFPSAFRNAFFENFFDELDFELYTTAFNVSTLFFVLVTDFGYIFTPFLFFFLGYVSFLIALKSAREPAYIVFRIVFLYALIISVFSNHMFHLVFFFQGLIGFLIIRGVKW